MSEDLIIKEIEANQDEYIEFLREIIKTDSYNPPGNEKNVAIKIDKYLKEVGIKIEIFPFGENRANLIAYLNDNLQGKNLLYNGHMDVVPPGGEDEWKYPPLAATIKRKKFLYGRGAADMKSGLVAMAIAIKILKKLDIKLKGNLIFNAVADEETVGLLGTKWCLEKKLNSIKCNFVIVGEATDFKPMSKAILLGEKGRVVLKIITNGVSCHASVPFLGINAIYMMSDIIQNLDKLDNIMSKVDPPISLKKLKNLLSVSFPNDESFNRVYNEQPLLSSTTLALTKFSKSLTMIKGGIKENVVPDQCEAKMDIRLLPGQTTEMAINALKSLINELGYQIKDKAVGIPEEIFVSIEIEQESEPSFWNDWEKSHELKEFYKIVENVYKKKPFYFLLPASADANYYRNNDYCPETIIFGPGVTTSAHTSSEYLEIQDFINSIKVYTLFAYNFLK